MKKKLINSIVLIIGFWLIIGFSRDILRLLKSEDRIKEAELQVEQLAKKQAELEQKKKYYQSEEFIEEQARNKLNLSREGDTVVVLPSNLGEIVGDNQPQEPPKIPNWRQWWQLFF